MSGEEVELNDLLFSLILLISIAAFALVGVYKMIDNNAGTTNHTTMPVNGAKVSGYLHYQTDMQSAGGGGGLPQVNRAMQYNYNWGDNIFLVGYFAGGGWLQMNASYAYYQTGSQYYFSVPSGSPWSVKAEATTANTNLKDLSGGVWDFSGLQNSVVDVPNTVYHIMPTEVS